MSNSFCCAITRMNGLVHIVLQQVFYDFCAALLKIFSTAFHFAAPPFVGIVPLRWSVARLSDRTLPHLNWLKYSHSKSHLVVVVNLSLIFFVGIFWCILHHISHQYLTFTAYTVGHTPSCRQVLGLVYNVVYFFVVFLRSFCAMLFLFFSGMRGLGSSHCFFFSKKKKESQNIHVS